MILDCYLPNITDGTWFSASKIAGPLGRHLTFLYLTFVTNY